MSRENLELVRDAVAAYNRGDLEAFFEYWSDDIDHRAVEGAPDDHGPIHGKNAFRVYIEDWFQTFDDLRLEPLEMVDPSEDKIVVVLRLSGRAKLSGVSTNLTYAALYTIRGGQIVRGREYWTRDEALEAAGLSE